MSQYAYADDAAAGVGLEEDAPPPHVCTAAPELLDRLTAVTLQVVNLVIERDGLQVLIRDLTEERDRLLIELERATR